MEPEELSYPTLPKELVKQHRQQCRNCGVWFQPDARHKIFCCAACRTEFRTKEGRLRQHFRELQKAGLLGATIPREALWPLLLKPAAGSGQDPPTSIESALFKVDRQRERLRKDAHLAQVRRDGRTEAARLLLWMSSQKQSKRTIRLAAACNELFWDSGTEIGDTIRSCQILTRYGDVAIRAYRSVGDDELLCRGL